MAMGTHRHRQRPRALFYYRELIEAPGHPFYRKLNEVLRAAGFDEFSERQCQRFYAERRGRPSLAPGVYFRLMLVGFFEGLDSERAIAWRAADSLSVREFVGYGLEEAAPGTYALLLVRAAAFGEPPARGDEVTVGGSVYKVVDLEADAEGGLRLVLHFSRAG
jgi:hypothetical protein